MKKGKKGGKKLQMYFQCSLPAVVVVIFYFLLQSYNMLKWGLKGKHRRRIKRDKNTLMEENQWQIIKCEREKRRNRILESWKIGSELLIEMLGF